MSMSKKSIDWSNWKMKIKRESRKKLKIGKIEEN